MSFANTFIPLPREKLNISTGIRRYFTKDLDYYIIPEGVTSIRPYAFYNFWPEGEEMTVILPKSLTYISPYAFSECAVKELVIPGGVKKIDHHAFYGAGLTKITFEEGLEEIGDEAFMDGPMLEWVVLPDSLKTIGKSAFSGMDVPGGVVIEIGEGIQSIGAGAFDCPVKSMVVHRKYGSITDGSAGYYTDKGDWVDPLWYGGEADNPQAIWDGDK